MTHVRFLTPFVIFLASLLAALLVVYYLSAEVEQVENEIRSIRSPDARETARRQAVVDQFRNLTHQTVTPTDPYHASQRWTEVASRTQNVDARTALARTSAYLNRLDERYRQIATIKAQHPVTLVGASPLAVEEQLTQARDLVAAIRNGLEGAITSARAHVPSDLRGALQTAESAARQSLSRIEEGLDIVSRVHASQRFTLVGTAAMAEGFDRAAAATNELIKALSFADSRPLPVLMASDPMRAAVRLQSLLLANGTERMRRPIDAELTFAEDRNRDIAFRALLSDYVREARSARPDSEGSDESRLHALSEAYLAGMTIEEVVDNQDLLIDMLVHQNHALAEQLMVTLGVRHPDDQRDYATRATSAIAEVRNRRNNSLREVTEDLVRVRNRESQRATDLGTARRALSESMNVELLLGFQNELSAVSQHRAQLQSDFLRLRDQFVRTRTEGLPRSSAALTLSTDDGNIIHADSSATNFQINLGSADNIRRGMRFLVIGEMNGERHTKGMIEVVRILTDGAAHCRLVQRAEGTPQIMVGDIIHNRFFYNGRFLRVACVGEFSAETSPISRERVERYLREMGCGVQAEADVNTDLVILDQPADRQLGIEPEVERYLNLRSRVSLDEVLIQDVMAFFVDR